MNTEPKPHLIELTREQVAPLLGREDEIGIPHIYVDTDGCHWARADEWRAFQAMETIDT